MRDRQIIEIYKALTSAQVSLIETQRAMMAGQQAMLQLLTRLLSQAQAERDLVLQRSQLVLN